MVEVILTKRIMDFTMGTVIRKNFCRKDAPSISADSYSSVGIPFRPAIMMMVLYPVHLQVMPIMTTALAPHTEFSQSTPLQPIDRRRWFTRPKSVLNSSLKIMA